MPQRSTLTSTSPSFGSGRSISLSCRTSGPPNSSIWIARMRAGDYSSRCTVSGENAGRQTAMYSAPPGSGVGRKLDVDVAQRRHVLEGSQLRVAQRRAQAGRLAQRALHDLLERPGALEQVGRGLLAHSLGARDPVRGIAAQGDEVGNEI